jgi:hypothetical protein
MPGSRSKKPSPATYSGPKWTPEPSASAQPKVVQIRPMTRKWVSCSTAGRVSFDSTLLRQHADFRKRIIVEELLHLRIPNLSKLFKTMLTAYLRRTI